GISQAAGAAKKYQNLGWNVHLGGGMNFNRWIGALIEYDFNDFGVRNSEMQTLFGSNYKSTGLYGRVHIWSFTVDPIVKYHRTEQTEEYLIGGGGYYRTRSRFSAPANGTNGAAGGLNPTHLVDAVADNAWGMNIGTGIMWKVSYLEDAKYFAEARYVWVNGPPLPDDSNKLYGVSTQRTGYFPVTVGIRW
ncbi:MAG TPA: hypothetical protein VGB94_13945, partial [Acidobacteriaceae bacterium]